MSRSVRGWPKPCDRCSGQVSHPVRQNVGQGTTRPAVARTAGEREKARIPAYPGLFCAAVTASIAAFQGRRVADFVRTVHTAVVVASRMGSEGKATEVMMGATMAKPKAKPRRGRPAAAQKTF